MAQLEYNPATGELGYWSGGVYQEQLNGDTPGGWVVPQTWTPVNGGMDPVTVAKEAKDKLMASLTPQETYQLANSVTASPTNPRETMAELIRANYADYTTRFKPLEELLKSYTTYNGNQGVGDYLKAKGIQAADTTFTGMEGMQRRVEKRMGIAPDPQAAIARSKENDLNRGLAEVDATNRATQFQQDLNRQIAAGSGAEAKKQFVGQ